MQLKMSVGIKEVSNTLKQLIAQSPEIVQRELFLAGERMKTDARNQSPVDTGNLRASIEKTLNRKSGEQSVSISADTEYALEVHETNKRYKVGKWKFLEDPLKKESAQFAEKLAQRFKREAEGAGK